MEKNVNCKRFLYIAGVAALIVGAIDPLEGSVLIAAGSLLLALITYRSHDRHWQLFLGFCAAILFGVGFLFYLSSLGGFGGQSTLSWWWGVLIIPYPLGWLATIILLILRAARKPLHPAGT